MNKIVNLSFMKKNKVFFMVAAAAILAIVTAVLF